jgi:pyridoxal phosphate enzyme (YggS family)
MSETSAVETFRVARARVLERIADACARASRDPAEVTVVAVSKTVDAAQLRDAALAGLTTLGENRVQEALGKVDEVPGVRWHLVGPLQSNKARRAVSAFELIQTVDSVQLAARLDRLAGEVGRASLPVLLQVNVDEDPAKAGFAPDDLPAALDDIGRLERLEIRGLMTIGRQVQRPDESRATFAGLRELSARLRARTDRLGPALSMGMSDNYPIAVEEGATLVRVGRALFGERPHHHGDDTHRH